MYRGFNLALNGNPFKNKAFFDKVYKTGSELHTKNKQKVRNVLNDFLTVDNELDASKMQADWFPLIKSDIFISHSHRDNVTAICLAGWIQETFSLVPFIDSCAWGYSDDLLSLIDNNFCLNHDKETYNYEKRNLSTSHVHMMLSTALSKMIDNSECIFFLNTPSSITPVDVIDGSNGTTTSPWIYSEIAMTRLIRKRSPDEHRGLDKKALIKSMLEQFVVRHPVELDHLTDLYLDDLIAWRKNQSTPRHALDILYNLKDSP